MRSNNSLFTWTHTVHSHSTLTSTWDTLMTIPDHKCQSRNLIKTAHFMRNVTPRGFFLEPNVNRFQVLPHCIYALP